MLKINLLNRFSFLAIINLVIFAGTVFADEPPPAWMQTAMRQTVPTYETKDVPAVVLLSDQTVTLNADGNLSTDDQLRRKNSSRATGETMPKQSFHICKVRVKCVI